MYLWDSDNDSNSAGRVSATCTWRERVSFAARDVYPGMNRIVEHGVRALNKSVKFLETCLPTCFERVRAGLT